MIINIKEVQTDIEGLHALNRREWQSDYKSVGFGKSEPIKIEFRKIIYMTPFLFLSGILTGVAIMLTLKG